MERLVFALTSMAALSLAACSGNNQDQVNNAEVNQANDQLSDEANQAAADAANAEAASLANQQQQLEDANATANPSDAQEQNVSGM